jgi:dihydroorotate dehydrogenase electron transfer subunit
MTEIFDQKPHMLRVEKKQVESRNFVTLFFHHNLPFKPGQFIMLWIPGIDEKPYTVSLHSKTQFAVTIEAKGIFSQKAINLDRGDLIGIRGPFGNGFDIKPCKNIAVIAGGCGMAPLATLVEKLDQNITFIHGARSREYVLYPERFDIERIFCTDDGSLGHKGLVTDILEKKITSGDHFDMVYACGPEIMMYTVFKMCEQQNISCQVSLERYMRCGFGVCGACICGREVVCMDGPVFGSKILRNMPDFNKKALLKSGREVDLSNYFSWRSK